MTNEELKNLLSDEDFLGESFEDIMCEAFCFRMIVKYNLDIRELDEKTGGGKYMIKYWATPDDEEASSLTEDGSLNRAIVRAVLEIKQHAKEQEHDAAYQ